MALGRHLRELWSHRPLLLACVAVAALAALWSVAGAGGERMGAASTRAIVDGPTSSVLDLSVPTSNLHAMTSRGVLVGNVIASAPVRAYIARRAHVSPSVLQIASPVTPDFPRPLATSGTRSTSDIVRRPDQYRISIQANPTVPILDISAQAPTAAAAALLANGAVQGMDDYLHDLAEAQHVPAANRVRLAQLGHATAGVINPGAPLELALLSFLLAFIASALAVLAVSRVRRGWQLA